MAETTTKAGFVIDLRVLGNADFLPDTDEKRRRFLRTAFRRGIAGRVPRNHIQRIETSYPLPAGQKMRRNIDLTQYMRTLGVEMRVIDFGCAFLLIGTGQACTSQHPLNRSLTRNFCPSTLLEPRTNGATADIFQTRTQRGFRFQLAAGLYDRRFQLSGEPPSVRFGGCRLTTQTGPALFLVAVLPFSHPSFTPFHLLRYLAHPFSCAQQMDRRLSL